MEKNSLAKHKFIPVSLCEDDLKEISGRYHFEGTGLILLRKIYRECFQAAEVSVYYMELIRYNNRIASPKGIAVLMTLGQAVDDSQELYMREERLSEAYAMECLAMEILKRAYEELELLLYKEFGISCAAYVFPGSDCPIEDNKLILEALQQREVSCNEVYALIPQKSVVYIMEQQAQQQEKVMHGRRLCTNCGREDCPNRITEEKAAVIQNEIPAVIRKEMPDIVNTNYNYGYQRIFREYPASKNRKQGDGK